MTASRAEPTMDSEFESDEEERFFSQPPEPDEEHTNPSMDLLLPRAIARSKEENGARAAELDRVFARRARLQRRVALWLGLGSAVILLAATLRHRSSKAAPRAVAVALQSSIVATSPPSSEPVRVEVTPIAPASAPPAPVEAAPIASVSTTEAEAEPAPAPAVSAPASEDAEVLRKRANAQLAAGRTRDGIASARAAIAADPSDARAYLLLAAGLEDLGDWAGARAVFSDCRKQATRGPSSTCNYFARR